MYIYIYIYIFQNLRRKYVSVVIIRYGWHRWYPFLRLLLTNMASGKIIRSSPGFRALISLRTNGINGQGTPPSTPFPQFFATIVIALTATAANDTARPNTSLCRAATTRRILRRLDVANACCSPRIS